MPTAQELYELWAYEAELDETLGRSFDPRGTEATAIKTFDPDVLQRAAAAAGLEQRSVDLLGSEWRESMLEQGTWNAGEDLLHLARLRRGDFDGTDAEAAWGGLVWGIYQFLGKTCPTVYVWSKASSS